MDRRAVTVSPRVLPRAVGGAIFGTDADGYHAARLGYPDQLYTAIRERCETPLPRVLEVAPGTGLATQDLLARLSPSRLVAVETDPALVAHLASRFADPRLAVVHSAFEQADIAGPFDLACCAAAFHWLDAEVAFRKLRQLVRPGGTLALWWNVYRQPGIGDRFADAVAPLFAGISLPRSETGAGNYSLDIEFHRAEMTGAGFTGFASFLFRRERVLDVGQVRTLYASYSYVRALPDDRRAELLQAICDLAEEQFGGVVPNTVLTALYLASAPMADSSVKA